MQLTRAARGSLAKTGQVPKAAGLSGGGSAADGATPALGRAKALAQLARAVVPECAAVALEEAAPAERKSGVRVQVGVRARAQVQVQAPVLASCAAVAGS